MGPDVVALGFLAAWRLLGISLGWHSARMARCSLALRIEMLQSFVCDFAVDQLRKYLMANLNND